MGRPPSSGRHDHGVCLPAVSRKHEGKRPIDVARDQHVRRIGAEATDQELVIAARSGQAWAQDALFRRYANYVYGMVFRLTGPSEAKELTQDALIQAFHAIGHLKEPAAFRSWLGGVTLRVVRRRSRRYRMLGLFSPYGSEDPAFAAAIDRTAAPDVALELKQVYALLDRLPPKLRLVFVLRRIEGMKLDEIATALDTSLASTKRWLNQAQERLDKLAEDSEPARGRETL